MDEHDPDRLPDPPVSDAAPPAEPQAAFPASSAFPAPAEPPVPDSQEKTAKKRSAGCLIAFLIVAGLGILCLMLLIVLFAVAAGSMGNLEVADTYLEKTVEGSGKDKIAVISVEGVILEMPASIFSSGNVVSRTVKQLQQAAADADVKAVIITVDSPGGGVTASDIIYNEVAATKAAGKKVVILMKDVAASGGYYISCPADKILAHPTTITGSIGVIFQTINVSGLMTDFKVKAETVKSAPMKDIGSGFRDMTPEERQVLQDMIDEMYERFVSLVADGRSMTPEEVKKVAQGQIYAASKAKELGLVDEIGYWDDAVAEAMSLAGIQQATVIRYASPPGLMQLLGEMKADGPLPGSAKALAEGLATPRPMYLWAPGL